MTAAGSIDGLRFGPIGAGTVHVVVDMQVVFADHKDWGAASTDEICRRSPHCRAPPGADRLHPLPAAEVVTDLPGNGSAFYRRWPQVVAESGNERAVRPAAHPDTFCAAGEGVDKTIYSAFEAPDFAASLARLAADA